MIQFKNVLSIRITCKLCPLGHTINVLGLRLTYNLPRVNLCVTMQHFKTMGSLVWQRIKYEGTDRQMLIFIY